MSVYPCRAGLGAETARPALDIDELRVKVQLFERDLVNLAVYGDQLHESERSEPSPFKVGVYRGKLGQRPPDPTKKTSTA